MSNPIAMFDNLLINERQNNKALNQDFVNLIANVYEPVVPREGVKRKQRRNFITTQINLDDKGRLASLKDLSSFYSSTLADDQKVHRYVLDVLQLSSNAYEKVLINNPILPIPTKDVKPEPLGDELYALSNETKEFYRYIRSLSKAVNLNEWQDGPASKTQYTAVYSDMTRRLKILAKADKNEIATSYGTIDPKSDFLPSKIIWNSIFSLFLPRLADPARAMNTLCHIFLQWFPKHASDETRKLYSQMTVFEKGDYRGWSQNPGQRILAPISRGFVDFPTVSQLTLSNLQKLNQSGSNESKQKAPTSPTLSNKTIQGDANYSTRASQATSQSQNTADNTNAPRRISKTPSTSTYSIASPVNALTGDGYKPNPTINSVTRVDETDDEGDITDGLGTLPSSRSSGRAGKSNSASARRQQQIDDAAQQEQKQSEATRNEQDRQQQVLIEAQRRNDDIQREIQEQKRQDELLVEQQQQEATRVAEQNALELQRQQQASQANSSADVATDASSAADSSTGAVAAQKGIFTTFIEGGKAMLSTMTASLQPSGPTATTSASRTTTLVAPQARPRPATSLAQQNPRPISVQPLLAARLDLATGLGVDNLQCAMALVLSQ